MPSFIKTKESHVFPVTCTLAIKKAQQSHPLSRPSMRSKPAATPECHLKPGNQRACVEAAAAEQEYFRLHSKDS